MYDFTHKTVVITGGASGIGRAAARLFAAARANVVIADIDQPAGEDLADKIRAGGGQCLYIHADVSQAADCQQVIQQTLDTFGSIDVLFNNAGIIRRASVVDIREEEWDRVMAVNVKSVYLMSKYAIPHMEKANGGVIVNTASGWGLVGGQRAVSYCASKAAVVNMTRAMALDHGPANVRVNCICPGDTDTPMLREEAVQIGISDSEFLAQAADRPLRRIGTPQEIAQAVLYLGSDAASYITGAVLAVDGGGTAG